MFSTGLIIAIFGAALAAICGGVGSAYGVSIAGRASAGVVSENPELFGKLLVIQALPGTQGIYGFLTAVMVMIKTGLLGGSPADLSVAQGWEYFMACMPIALAGLFSAIYQGQCAVAAIHMTAKQPDASARGITMVALVETYAILGLLVSILLILIGIK